ncbi:hypothetical protein HAX54_004621, partial [Datura stramonium]|nr:hypothetical protein [Datura stramonium]
MERGQDMAQIKAQMELITKHLTSMNAHKVQVVNMQRETYRYGDYYPDYEEKVDFADYLIRISNLLKQRADNDRCMVVAARSGEPNVEENDLDMVEAREWSSVLSNPRKEGCNAP